MIAFTCGEYLNLEIHGYLIVEAQLLLELDFNKCYTATTNSVTCYHSIWTFLDVLHINEFDELFQILNYNKRIQGLKPTLGQHNNMVADVVTYHEQGFVVFIMFS